MLEIKPDILLPVLAASTLIGVSGALAVVAPLSEIGPKPEPCYALAIVGMDSSLNKSLGVSLEDAVAILDRKTDTRYEEVIIGAYLTEEVPLEYFLDVYLTCAYKKETL